MAQSVCLSITKPILYVALKMSVSEVRFALPPGIQHVNISDEVMRLMFDDCDDDDEQLQNIGSIDAAAAAGSHDELANFNALNLEMHNLLRNLQLKHKVPMCFLGREFIEQLWSNILKNPNMHLYLPKNCLQLDAGRVLEHGVKACEIILNKSLCQFKIGITHLPLQRWNKYFLEEHFSNITFIYISEDWHFPAFLEASLIFILKDRFRGCQNYLPGGESASHGSPPFFTYIVHRRI
jgi:hypothetical protein